VAEPLDYLDDPNRAEAPPTRSAWTPFRSPYSARRRSASSLPGSPFATGAAVFAPGAADGIDTPLRGMGGSIGVAVATLSAVDSRRSLLRPDRSGDTGGSAARVT